MKGILHHTEPLKESVHMEKCQNTKCRIQKVEQRGVCSRHDTAERGSTLLVATVCDMLASNALLSVTLNMQLFKVTEFSLQGGEIV